ncbi:MAG: ABC transporter permease [Bacteroidota bacterium]
MLANYLRVALRALRKHRGYTAINVLGLAVGIAASVLILQYVTYERSYDAFHTDGDRIYRVQYDFLRDGETVFQSATAFPKVGPAMIEELPEVEDAARLFLHYGGGVVRVTAPSEEGGPGIERSFAEDFVFTVDPSFLAMFDYPWVAGDRATALDGPGEAVLSVETARKYFGDADPLGQRFRFGNNLDYEVTGVIESPETSHLKFNVLLSYETLVQAWGDGFDTAWGWYDFYNYIRLTPGTTPASVEAKFPAFIERHGGEGASAGTVFALQPLGDIHLTSDLLQEARVNGDGTAVTFLAIIAGLILLIAWVNYVNLATARAVERAKEIGVRKTLGANRGQLMRQFLFESLLVNVLAAVLALGLTLAAWPLFEALVGKPIPLAPATNAPLWLAMLGVLVAGAIVAGLYPALVLSAYRPVTVLKGAFARSTQGLTLRRGLVVAQFAASVGLVAGTVLVAQQLTYMRGQDLGVDIDQMVILDGPGVQDSTYSERYDAFKQEVERMAGVRTIAASTEIPGNLIYWTNGARQVGQPSEATTIMYRMGVGEDFLESYDLDLLAGRRFRGTYEAEQPNVILNETALRVLGLPDASQDDLETVLGEQVQIGGDTLSVVGVVADHHQQDLQQDYYQIAYVHTPYVSSYFSAKLTSAATDVPTTLASLESAYREFFPGNPFEYAFLDQHFDRQYRTDRQFGQVFSFFALLAIGVACLGLLGLASFIAAQRTKEIGVRKVLGASVGGILLLLTKDFVRLVVIGAVVATPVVWWLMERWLDGYAFRIDVGPGAFLLATALTLAVALATVSVQSLRAAQADPVRSLRYD